MNELSNGTIFVPSMTIQRYALLSGESESGVKRKVAAGIYPTLDREGEKERVLINVALLNKRLSQAQY
ncbi:hypothetical protein [Teredinibacter turnerae]|uniref:hypothetical protein n=1 Tax=Teredinibacter turnerae TaxID=2426 RepID=UPI000ACFF67B|nr:hypothetical protein [Teredinibacter turnerae]